MSQDELINKIKSYINNNDDLKYLQLHNNIEVNFLAQGEYNINYTIHNVDKKYVFRINTGSQLQLENQIKYEYESIKWLEQSNVTPKVYYYDDSLSYFEYGILIMEFLEGRPLAYDKDLLEAAHIFSNIHSLQVHQYDHFVVEEKLFNDRIREGERLLTNVWDSSLVSKDVKLIFEKIIDWLKVNKDRELYFINDRWHVVNNTEVNSHNFIIGKDKSYLIDWEKPVISDPSQDLTQFIAPTTTMWRGNYILTEEEKDYFFNKYITGLNGSDKNIKERVHLYTPYLYFRALSWCAYAFIEYHDPNKTIKNMDTFEKIKSYLQVDFINDLYKPFW